MSLSPEATALIEDEERCLSQVLHELESQQAQGARRLRQETERAQDLSKQIVASRRDTDKQMLASDEAVAHGLATLKRDEVEGIEKMLDKPYFARIQVEEEDPDGKLRKIEFRLGTSSNLECRIIDWRKAPMARLYYEYQEGDEYCEEIQGRERIGRVLMRHKVDISKSILRSLTCRLGTFRRGDAGWVEGSGRARGTSDSKSYSQLPDILSLITAEQFQTITGDVEQAVMIQGVAGSGKTTIALHRLAWLLHGENSDLQPSDCAVVVLSASLQGYIRRSLEQLGVVGVPVLTYPEWSAPTVAKVFGIPVAELPSRRPTRPSPPGTRRVLGSLALLRTLEEHATGRANEPTDVFPLLLEALAKPHRILELDETRLLDRDLIAGTAAYLAEQYALGRIEPLAEPLLTRLVTLGGRGIVSASGQLRKHRHLVVDEVQDVTAPELASLVGAVEKLHQLTLVGDTSQASRHRSAFPVWEKLQKLWSLGESLSRFITLSVSHRSTNAIMRLAHHVQESQPSQGGRPGKPPIWFSCRTENQAVEEAIGWLQRVTEKYPGAPTVVLCRSDEEAKYCHSLLRPTFGPSVSRVEGGRFSFEEGILVAPISAVKGLEFPNVMIWNVSASSYPPEDRSRNLLYIAITRAEEHLCLITWGKPSKLLPALGSPIVRGIPRGDEEEEQEQREELNNTDPWE